MTRVAVQIGGVVEVYDDAGRLVESKQVQPMQVAGMSAAALAESLNAVRDQLVSAWAAPVASASEE